MAGAGVRGLARPAVPEGLGVVAIISPDGRYRYRLERPGEGSGLTAVIMVNPSTADAVKDDATIRKVRGFGARNAWGRIVVGNLFAYRATDVRELAGQVDPIGPDNDLRLCEIFLDVDRVVFAWGPLAKQPRALRDRWRTVDLMARTLGFKPLCLGVAKDGHPRHPLMVPYADAPRPWPA